MEKIVFTYLNKHYYVDRPLRIHWVIAIDSNEGINNKQLTNELEGIFSLHKEVVLFLIKEWVYKFFQNVDITDYLNYGLGGYVFVPYIPIEDEVIVISADGFQPSHRISSRYGEATINPDYYQYLQINNDNPWTNPSST